jgi:Domain of unknown function (DUF4129)
VHDGVQRRLARSDGSRAYRSARAVRLILAVVLVATTMVGLRAAASMSWHVAQGPASRRIPATVGLAVVLAMLLIALLVLHARRPFPGQPAAVLRRTLTLVTSLGLVALAAAFVISLLQSRSSHKMPPGLQPTPTPSPSPTAALKGRKFGHTTLGGDLGTLLIYALIAVLVVIAILALLSLLRRRRARAPEAPEPEPDDSETLRDVVQAGQAALRAISDARRAIIACYAAMESGLGRAGAERGTAETPDELLARISAGGLVRGGGAARLTRLFYEARYSEHEVPDAARQAALHSLQDIEIELDERQRHARTAVAP